MSPGGEKCPGKGRFPAAQYIRGTGTGELVCCSGWPDAYISIEQRVTGPSAMSALGRSYSTMSGARSPGYTIY